MDFLYKPTKNKKGKESLKAHFARVEYDLSPVPQPAVWDGVIQADSMWAYPKQGSCKMKMREVYKDHGRFVSQAKKLQKWILVNFSEEQQYEKFQSHINEWLPSEDDLEWQEKLSEIQMI